MLVTVNCAESYYLMRVKHGGEMMWKEVAII
jgi:hypothetical protein